MSWYVAKVCFIQMHCYFNFLNIIIIMNSAGESGLVYKGYIDTSIGSELVAVKTGKGIKKPVLRLIFTELYFH